MCASDERGGEDAREAGSPSKCCALPIFAKCASGLAPIFAIYKVGEQWPQADHVVRLTDEERVEEVARMIGGATPTTASRAAAQELLGQGESEHRAKGESESRRKAKAK